MKTKLQLLVSGLLLAGAGTGLGQAPTITTQPTSQTVCTGTDATLVVEATGTDPLTYQWQANFGAGFVDQTDYTNSILVLTNVQYAQSGWYRVVVTDSTGSTTSGTARLDVQNPPSVSLAGQPTNWLVLSLGATVANRVAASGTAPFSYQWRLNGQPLAGQTRSSISLTNLQAADAGTYDVVVANACGSVISTGRALSVDTTFTKITSGVIVTDAEGSCTGNWADYDNDGFVDPFVANSIANGTTLNALYHNLGGTNFSRVAAAPVATDLMRVWNAAWGDYDNDGNVDLIAANIDGGLFAQRLYRNIGGGSFTAVVDSALRSDTAAAICPWWLDYDNDGFLDLFVVKGMYPVTSANDCLFRNKGDGTFKKMTIAEVGQILNDQMGGDSCWSVDYDNDGRQELTVLHANTFLTWRPQANGTFVSTPVGLPDGLIPLWWGDYDNDGWQDVFCYSGSDRRPHLFRNLGSGGGFTNATAAFKVTMPVQAVEATWGDYDNDGWLDVFFTGVYWYSTNTIDGLFRNNGDGTFTQIVTGSPVYDGESALSPSWIDYDNDGFLDLFIAVGDATPQRNRLYRNNGNTNHWLKVKLDGRASNRSGIGAKVRAQATVNGQTFWQVREISSGMSYVGQNGLLAHFGLGDATNITTLRIEWPSGIVQELHNVAANQLLTLTEHQEYAGPLPRLANPTPTTGGLQLSIIEPAAPAVYSLEASTDLVTWTKLMARTSAGSTFDYTDTRAASATRRFYRVVVP